jgi:hypothetical protein
MFGENRSIFTKISKVILNFLTPEFALEISKFQNSGTNIFNISYVESKNKFKSNLPSVKRRCRRCRPGVGQNWYRRYLSRLMGYRFEISANLHHLSWIDAPLTQNFEIWKSLERTQV